MKNYLTKSEEETRNLASKIANYSNAKIFALKGDLGSGKTTFVQGFAKGLGIKEKIISPTFVLVRIHKIPKTKKFLYHIDLYRLENEKQIKDFGILEIIQDPKNIVLIEWAEKAKSLLPKETIWIHFETISSSLRKITIK